MTIPASMPYKVSYEGDGVTVNFPVPFVYFANTDGTKQLQVVLADEYGENEVVQVENTNFTITDAGQPSGTLTMNVAPNNHYKLTIVYNIPIEQLVDWEEFGRLPSQSIETAFDKVTAILKQIKEITDRCVKVTVSGNQTPEELLDEVYSKLDSATEIAATAISAANRATTAAENATEAVEGAEQTLIDVTAYVDAAEAAVNTAVSNAEESIAQTVATAEANIEGAITSAIDDVEAAAISAANAVLERAEETVTQAAQGNIDDYVTQTAQANINSYVNNTTKPAIDAYVNTSSKPAIDSYVTTTAQANINSYVNNTTKPAIDAYASSVLSPYTTSASNSATAAAQSAADTQAALAEALELTGYAEIFGGYPNDGTDDEIVGGVL